MERTITNRYRTECYNCHNPIKEGTEVRWIKGTGVRCMDDCPERVKGKNGSWGNYKHRATKNVRQVSS